MQRRLTVADELEWANVPERHKELARLVHEHCLDVESASKNAYDQGYKEGYDEGYGNGYSDA